jgi:hypothetical protein
VSWDVLLQKFDRGSEATFDLDRARELLRQTSGFCEIEPGVGEIDGDEYAEIFYGVEPSSDVMISVRAASPVVYELIWELAAHLRMAVFFPTEDDWRVAVLDRSQADDLPDASWEGWERFDDGFTPPDPFVCEDAEALASVLRSSYDGWHSWAHRGD